MAIDWDAVEEQYDNGGFKEYAKPGIYTVKCDGVEFKQVGTKGNYVMKFHFEETETLKFPTADHFLSKEKDNWRIHHTKNLFLALGASEEKAKKGCEMAEEKGDYEYAVKVYEKGFDALLTKKPEVQIEVYPDGEYTRSEFYDRRVSMPHEAPKKDALVDFDDGMEVEIDTSELPF